MRKYSSEFILIVFVLFAFCKEKEPELKRFQLLNSDYTGVTFNNNIELTDDFNVLDFDYIYNGAGVAAGDFNGDGLTDLFFAGNSVTSTLYLNQGEFKFLDITEHAKITTENWVEGVTLVDINHDGLLDIYLSISNRDETKLNPNLLFVNQGVNAEGIPTFEEQAEAYGIADRGYNTQAAFFDYDGDGHLDLYILSNALESFQRNTSRPREMSGKGKSNDKLYRNNGDGTFTNVTQEAGILIEGYGLGLAISDINQDGWPDIYVANDFISNDILYINNGDGTFTNRIAEMINHQSFNAMGIDIADFNNDGLPDIMVLDMFPPDNLRQKTMFAPTENYDLYFSNLDKGYEPQYVRNTLQLNRGNGNFSEIGFLAGVAQTDWSWSPLFADLDNDGAKDLLVSNGYGKDITDMDYVNYTQNLGPFSTADDRRNLRLDGISKLDEVRLANYIFKNEGDLSFSDQSQAWGFTHPSISNGMVYADLDNDGQLDVVFNNLNGEAFIYKNQSNEITPDSNHFLRVTFTGSEKNTLGLGVKLKLTYETNGKSESQYYEHFPTRGYKSFVEPIAHFGLGEVDRVSSLEITWPDGKKQLLEDMKSNQVINLSHTDAMDRINQGNLESEPIFEEVSQKLGISYSHSNVKYKDFNRQRLLPHKHSENGPSIAVGDINGDGLEDFFVSGNLGKPGHFFIQNRSGKFDEKALSDSDEFDDMGSLLFDLDNDGDLDLYVVSGGSRYPEGSLEYQDRIYINDGKGNLTLEPDIHPKLDFSGSVATAADFDGDGFLDLFVGGRVRPGQYPLAPRSALLKNNKGQLEDVTASVLPELENLGMVTAALWTDFDSDGLIDLIVVGEWMPIKFFKQVRSAVGEVRFEDVSNEYSPENSSGWWNSIAALPFESENGPNYVLGNAGENVRWKASADKPLRLVAKDFDNNQSTDPIMFQHLGDAYFAVPGRDMLLSQVPSWKNRFLTYSGYATTDLSTFFQPADTVDAIQLKAATLSSAKLKADASGRFRLEKLPAEAQFAPKFGLLAMEEDNLLLTGNFYGNETVTGRYDASKGIHLTNERESYETKKLSDSGFLVEGEGRALTRLVLANESWLILAVQHAGPLKVFQKNEVNPTRVFKLMPGDYKAIIKTADGRKITREFYYGEGYLSQASRAFEVLPNYVSADLINYQGERRTVVFRD